jgi:hypothetical protein
MPLPKADPMPLAAAARFLNVCPKVLRRMVWEGFFTPDARGWFSLAELEAGRRRIKEGKKTDGAL